MRALLLALLFTPATAAAFAQTKIIPAAEAKYHIGETLMVEGMMSEVHHAASGNEIFLDMGGHYPNQQFTAVIFKDDSGKFPNADSLEGKTVDITGMIKLYKGRPEIILNDPGQIKAK